MSLRRRKPFWDRKWGTDKICGIFHTRLRPGKNKDEMTYSVFLKCGHGFCRTAITKWINTKMNCPICRRNIDPIELF